LGQSPLGAPAKKKPLVISGLPSSSNIFAKKTFTALEQQSLWMRCSGKASVADP